MQLASSALTLHFWSEFTELCPLFSSVFVLIGVWWWAMVLLKMKFTQQRRVRLAQGLWLLSWLAVMCGTFIFCLGVYLKTELLRRAEVERRKYTRIHTNECNVSLKTRGPSLKTLRWITQTWVNMLRLLPLIVVVYGVCCAAAYQWCLFKLSSTA